MWVRRRHIVTESTGCSDHQLSEDLYKYFARADSWAVAPRAMAALSRLRDAGVQFFYRLVVRNFV